MSEKILVPVLGESIVEATVSKWLKNEGDIVEADEPVVELETDKVNLEVPSPTSGVLEKINSKDGSVVEVGATLGSVSVNGVSSKKKEVEVIEINKQNNNEKIKEINMVKKHVKTTKEKKGGIVSKESFIHLSNLKLIDEKAAKKIEAKK